MSSTYSPNLGFELINTGEQSGTWGVTTNTNLGTLIEQSIVGVGSIVFASDANKTITLTNGASSDTRCFYLVVTSGVSLTATRSLIVPTISKNYMVYNNTTGGQSITVTTVAGTGVTVLSGKSALVQVDGVNVIPQFTYAPSLAVTTQAPGDNTVNAASTAFVQAAVGSVSTAPSGAVSAFAGSSAPSGWLLCYGQAVSRATYSGLFVAISTVYGIGDGSTTFNLPDLRGRSVFGQDNMGGSTAGRITNANSGITGTTLGAAGGTELLHAHSHTGTTGTESADHSHSGGMDEVQNLIGGGSGAFVHLNTQPLPFTGGISNSHTHSFTSNNAGTGASQNMPPTVIMNYIIKT